MRSIAIAVLICLVTGCGRKALEVELNNPIPPGNVSLSIDLDHEGMVLSEPLSYLQILEPRYAYEYTSHDGIVVVHGAELGKFYAYDLLCPNEWPSRIRVEMEGEGLLAATCPKCGTIYELALGIGNPIGGNTASKFPLRPYRVIKRERLLLVRNQSHW